ncbi:hypothetical protein LMG7141_00893 [Ralstonia condita]|uniref:Uncharacterized protein n=1 Tax=Ralstonia condita TaxID=3058600 RepID=A0ABN9II49_9RALS|nr:hypothetical protein LMG7141_00893 [Ralstonia sp. LMG 7141]
MDEPIGAVAWVADPRLRWINRGGRLWFILDARKLPMRQR